MPDKEIELYVITKKGKYIQTIKLIKNDKKIIEFYKKRGYEVKFVTIVEDKLIQFYVIVMDFETGEIINKDVVSVPFSYTATPQVYTVAFQKIISSSTESFESAIKQATLFRNKIMRC